MSKEKTNKKDQKDRRKTKRAYKVLKGLEAGLEHGLTVRIEGSAGIGKTSIVTQFAEEQGLQMKYLSGANCTPQDLVVPYPKKDDDGNMDVTTLLHGDLLTDDPKILVVDEASRVRRSMLNILMELCQEHTIAGEDIPNLKMVVLLDNPAGDGDYQGVAGMDLAQADRFVTFQVTAADIPWREHLEGQYEDEIQVEQLHRLWDTWARWDGRERTIVSPRIIEHSLELYLQGLPIEWALPVLGSGRMAIRNKNGDDVTSKRITDIYEALGGAPVKNITKPVEKLTAAAMERNWKIRIVGPPGIGKTSYVKAAVAAQGVGAEYLSASLVSPQDLYLPIPKDGKLQFLPAKRLSAEQPKYWLIADEFSRAPISTASAFMELIQEGSLGGVKLSTKDVDGNVESGLCGVIALDNPAEKDGIQFDAGRVDFAQASRFHATVEVDDDDVPWREFLDKTYGEEIQPFASWRAEDLDAAGRRLVTPRCLERMLKLHRAGLDPKDALPIIGGNRVEVDLAGLYARLKNRVKMSFGVIVKDLDNVLKQMDEEDIEVLTSVHRALTKADLVEMKKNMEAVVELFRKLPPDKRLAQIARGKPERKKFFTDVLLKMGGNDA